MSARVSRSRPMSPQIPELRDLTHQPNEPWGWAGTWPLSRGAAVPPNRASVVYTLFEDGAPIYIGVTDLFRERMKSHQRGCKKWTSWTAVFFPDRAAADRAEVSLISKVRPPLNRWVDGAIVKRGQR
jgi:hypothetical protein